MSTYLPTLFGESLMDMFDSFDQNFFRGMRDVDRQLYGRRASRMMNTDVRETDSTYELDIDLPGFKKDELKLELNNGYLTITASKGLNKNDENKQGKIVRQERYTGTMQRSFYVGANLTEDEVKATLEDGVLKLSIPKENERKVPEKKTICIG